MSKFISGMYAWGGPGTTRLLQVKYRNPQIDIQSFLTLYDQKRLTQAKSVFNLTDVWVSFSWGFSDQTEKEDYSFIEEKLPTFKKLNLRTHAYVQGLNVVESEFMNKDIYCRDLYGRKLPYSRGRKLVCPNNPHVRTLISNRVKLATSYKFDGVYVDNILFGFPPSFIRSNFAPFFGCFCIYCQQEFKKQYKYSLSFPLDSNEKIRDYLSFRSNTTKKMIHDLSDIAHNKGKLFGINLFDPLQMNSEVYFGYNFQSVKRYLDYLFIENHSLPNRKSGNAHITDLVNKSTKPVIVLSYDQGIGFEEPFKQEDFNSIRSESLKLGCVPCYKVSEYTTDGKWHTLDFDSLHTVQTNSPETRSIVHTCMKLPMRKWFDPLLSHLSGLNVTPLTTMYFENPLVNRVGNSFYQKSLHSWKNFEI